MDELATPEIPVGFFEYRTRFKQPIFSAWFEGKTALLQHMYNVLVPWGIDPEKVSANTNARNLKEAQVTLSIPKPPVVVNFDIGGVTIIANNADWSEAPVLSEIFQSILNTLMSVGGAELDAQQTILGFHVKPGPKPFREVMKQFINTKALGHEDAAMYGVGLYGPEYSLILDNSATVVDGLFVKITRVFPTATSFDEMASILWKDEERVLNRLGFKMEQP